MDDITEELGSRKDYIFVSSKIGNVQTTFICKVCQGEVLVFTISKEKHPIKAKDLLKFWKLDIKFVESAISSSCLPCPHVQYKISPIYREQVAQL